MKTTPTSGAADLRTALVEACRVINSMKVEAETAAQGDEQMMLEACETISNEGLRADMAIRAALASVPAQAISAEPVGAWIERWHGSGGKDGHEGWSIVEVSNRSLVAYLGREVDSDAVTAIVMAHNALRASHGQAPAGTTVRHLEAVIKGAADKLDAAVRCHPNAIDALIHEALEILDGDREPYCAPSPQAADTGAAPYSGMDPLDTKAAQAPSVPAVGVPSDAPWAQCTTVSNECLGGCRTRAEHERYAPQPASPADSVLEDAARLERERICAAIKAEDDYCVDNGDYMLDSDDCIKIVRAKWVRPDFFVDTARKQGGANG